jgi:hypothetical protein
MEGVKVEPLRSLDDFLLNSARFQTPNFGDLERWSKRVKENLVYYQSNYFLMIIIIFLIVGIANPGQMLLGMAVVAGMMVAYNQLTKNQRVAMDFKKEHPLACLILILVGVYLIISLLGSVLVFLFGVCLPLSATFIHASLRLRNVKNKLANMKEKLTLKKTPMGIILEELGMAVEIFDD